MHLPHIIEQLVDHFSRFSGIGRKSALKLALELTRWRDSDLSAFAQALDQVSLIQRCPECGSFTDGEDLCQICRNQSRYQSRTLCVIETLPDLLAIEKCGRYHGLYHILNGVLNPLKGKTPESLRIEALIARIEHHEITSVILALNPSVEGDVTCNYLRSLIPQRVCVQRLGLGMPMGGSLEFLDSMTIDKALENRTIL